MNVPPAVFAGSRSLRGAAGHPSPLSTAAAVNAQEGNEPPSETNAPAPSFLSVEMRKGQKCRTDYLKAARNEAAGHGLSLGKRWRLFRATANAVINDSTPLPELQHWVRNGSGAS